MDESKKDKIEGLEEIEEIYKNIELKEFEKDVSIIWDGIQYSVRIPKKFAEIIEVNSKKDIMRFRISGTNKNPVLNGKLIKNAK